MRGKRSRGYKNNKNACKEKKLDKREKKKGTGDVINEDEKRGTGN